MPLSDHEQRLLEQMERALYKEDPKFATSLRNGRDSLHKGRVITGSLGVVLGLLLILTGVATSLVIVGVVGFALMVAGAFWAYAGFGNGQAAPSAAGAAGSAKRSARGAAHKDSDFMGKMEERWKKRREDGESGLR